MTLLKIVEPEVGTKNSVADPRIPAALKEIEKVVNGELEGTNNLKAEGVLEGNLSKELQEKLTTKLGLKLEVKNESLTGVSEHLYVMEKEASTLELPAPTLNRMIGITCANSINAVKVKCSSGKVFSGLHPTGATTVEVTKGSTLIVIATGTNWFVFAGEEKPDNAATRPTKSKAECEAGVELSSIRPAIVIAGPTDGSEFGATTPQVGGVLLIDTSASHQTTFTILPGEKYVHNKETTFLVRTL